MGWDVTGDLATCARLDATSTNTQRLAKVAVLETIPALREGAQPRAALQRGAVVVLLEAAWPGLGQRVVLERLRNEPPGLRHLAGR